MNATLAENGENRQPTGPVWAAADRWSEACDPPPVLVPVHVERDADGVKQVRTPTGWADLDATPPPEGRMATWWATANTLAMVVPAGLVCVDVDRPERLARHAQVTWLAAQTSCRYLTGGVSAAGHPKFHLWFTEGRDISFATDMHAGAGFDLIGGHGGGKLVFVAGPGRGVPASHTPSEMSPEVAAVIGRLLKIRSKGSAAQRHLARLADGAVLDARRPRTASAGDVYGSMVATASAHAELPYRDLIRHIVAAEIASDPEGWRVGGHVPRGVINDLTRQARNAASYAKRSIQ